MLIYFIQQQAEQAWLGNWVPVWMDLNSHRFVRNDGNEMLWVLPVEIIAPHLHSFSCSVFIQVNIPSGIVQAFWLNKEPTHDEWAVIIFVSFESLLSAIYSWCKIPQYWFLVVSVTKDHLPPNKRVPTAQSKPWDRWVTAAAATTNISTCHAIPIQQ